MPPAQIPHVTILRPAKGLEPYLYECLASSFHQDYPADKLTVYFCVTSTDDPAYAVMRRLLEDFPGRDARIFIEDEDPLLRRDTHAEDAQLYSMPATPQAGYEPPTELSALPRINEAEPPVEGDMESETMDDLRAEDRAARIMRRTAPWLHSRKS